tara:strand:- start:112 stop:372 length:261 start_codon:yes stop_codon:yes gene_type:complete
MNREELKRLWFSLDYSNVKERKQIIVEIGKNPYWPGYGDVEILSEGPDGYSSFKTHQENPLQYAKDRMSEGFDGLRDLSKYELIIK